MTIQRRGEKAAWLCPSCQSLVLAGYIIYPICFLAIGDGRNFSLFYRGFASRSFFRLCRVRTSWKLDGGGDSVELGLGIGEDDAFLFVCSVRSMVGG